MRTLIIVILITPLIVTASGRSPDEPNVASPHLPAAIRSKAETNREKVVAGLSPLSFLVGDWKGVAQPKRGSNSGAWSENAHTFWCFEEQDSVPAAEPGTRREIHPDFLRGGNRNGATDHRTSSAGKASDRVRNHRAAKGAGIRDRHSGREVSTGSLGI